MGNAARWATVAGVFALQRRACPPAACSGCHQMLLRVRSLATLPPVYAAAHGARPKTQDRLADRWVAVCTSVGAKAGCAVATDAKAAVAQAKEAKRAWPLQN